MDLTAVNSNAMFRKSLMADSHLLVLLCVRPALDQHTAISWKRFMKEVNYDKTLYCNISKSNYTFIL